MFHTGNRHYRGPTNSREGNEDEVRNLCNCTGRGACPGGLRWHDAATARAFAGDSTIRGERRRRDNRAHRIVNAATLIDIFADAHPYESPRNVNDATHGDLNRNACDCNVRADTVPHSESFSDAFSRADQYADKYALSDLDANACTNEHTCSDSDAGSDRHTDPNSPTNRRHIRR